jgi:hypothetical protein
VWRSDWGSCSGASAAAMQFYVRQSDQSRVVIPMHKGELKRKTLRAIIQDLKINVEEFGNLL